MHIFSPNAILSKSAVRTLIISQVAILCVVWFMSPFVLLPNPSEVANAMADLWQQGLGAELITSFYLNLQAIALATGISLVLAYASVIPFFRPAVIVIGRLRFLPIIGLIFFFTVLTSSGHELKLTLLVFSISVFFVTCMVDVIKVIPKEQFDLARTLRMGEWRLVWEVIVLGQIDKAFDVLRQNAAMSMTLLTLVESIVRSEGGIGAMLMDQNHHFHLAAVFAIQLTILFLGLVQDYGIGLAKEFVCPYAFLKLEKA